ncbi:MAG: hypothetical protein R3D60_02550 [Paracoccaceae bacterium]
MEIRGLIDETERLLCEIEGYGTLSPDEKELIRFFAVAWSLFEERCLERNGGMATISCLAERSDWRAHGEEPVCRAFGYFYHRYFIDDEHETRFHSLCFGRNNDPENDPAQKLRKRLASLSKEESPTDPQILEFVLLVIYRLRNNLLHGNKNDNISGQTDNFFHALSVINFCVEHNLRTSP